MRDVTYSPWIKTRHSGEVYGCKSDTRHSPDSAETSGDSGKQSGSPKKALPKKRTGTALMLAALGAVFETRRFLALRVLLPRLRFLELGRAMLRKKLRFWQDRVRGKVERLSRISAKIFRDGPLRQLVREPRQKQHASCGLPRRRRYPEGRMLCPRLDDKWRAASEAFAWHRANLLAGWQ